MASIRNIEAGTYGVPMSDNTDYENACESLRSTINILERQLEKAREERSFAQDRADRLEMEYGRSCRALDTLVGNDEAVKAMSSGSSRPMNG